MSLQNTANNLPKKGCMSDQLDDQVTYKPLPIEPCTLVKEFQLAQCTTMAEART
jgi:hypothetical protein